MEPVELSKDDARIVKNSIARVLTSYDKNCPNVDNALGLCTTVRASKTCLYCGKMIHPVNSVFVYKAELITMHKLENVDAVEQRLDSTLPFAYQRLVLEREPTVEDASLYEMDEWFE